MTSLFVVSLLLINRILFVISQDLNHTYVTEIIENYRKVKFHLNQKFRTRSVINFGELTLSTKKKLIDGKCLRIVAFGGSVTCGR